MTTLDRLQHWRASGRITEEQFESIAALVRKDRFSVFLELNGLLYLGVLSLVAGVGWTIREYLANIGDGAIITALTGIVFASFYYCFTRALPYSPEQVESPNIAFDYVLYAGCLVFALELTYLESRFHVLQDYWDFYLLFSALVFFACAYRFDNRLVLSLALSSLAGWFGIRLSQFTLNYAEFLRPYAIGYGIVVAAAGWTMFRRGVKKHFTETYLHIAANVMFVAMLSGAYDVDSTWLYLPAVLGLSAIAIVGGIHFKRFAFVAYGTVYAYAAISMEVLRNRDTESMFALTYLIISGSLVILAMVFLARIFGREE
jgi:hypothetical protein